MTVIKKKSWPKVFEAVRTGKKKFEVRLADFAVKKGDILVLAEWDPKTKKFTGREIRKKVDFVYTFRLDAFGQKKAIEKKGLHIIQF